MRYSQLTLLWASFLLLLCIHYCTAYSEQVSVGPHPHYYSNAGLHGYGNREEDRAVPVVSGNLFSGVLSDFIYFDQSPNLLILEETKGQLFFSKGFGKPWEAVDLNDIISDNKQIKIVKVVKNPYNAKELFAITDKAVILHTTNYGSSWKSIELPEVLPIKEVESKKYINNEFLSNTQNNTFPVQFHPNKESEYIFAGKCQSKSPENDNSQHCIRQFYYGRNKLSEIKPLLRARGCLFTTPRSKNDTVMCLTESGSITGSKTLFKKPTKDKNDSSKDTDKDASRSILQDTNILQIYYFNSLFIGISLNNIYLSTDGLTWTTKGFNFKVPNRFAMNLVAGAYKNTLMLAVKLTNQVGAFYKISLNPARNEITIVESLPHIHRDITGIIDFDTVEHVEGVSFANVMTNGKDVIKGNYKDIKLKSLVTFDNGENWKFLKGIDHGSKTVNLHSIIRKSIGTNYARSQYRLPYTPEVLMGVGNSGDSLENYSNSDTWLSLDQGKTWNKTLQGPHVFQFANSGSLIIAIPDTRNKLKDLRYSFDFGHSWQSYNFADKCKLNNARFVDCITVPNSSTGKLILITEDNQRTKFEALNLDFTDVLKEFKSCDKFRDFDTISISDSDEEEFCFMGFKQTFKRRKPDVLCSVSEQITEVAKEPCYCTQSDYECAIDFYTDVNGNCITNNTQLSGHHLSAKYCDGKTKSYFKPSGYMIKSGDECFADKHAGLKIDDNIEVPCENYKNDDDDDDNSYNDKNSKVKLGKKLKANKNATGDYISSYDFQFDGSVIQFDYLLPSKNKKGYSGDENVIILTSNNKAYFTYNQGMQWQDIYPNDNNDRIIGYYVNVQKGWISLISSSGKVIYSHNNGYTWRTFHSPISSFTSTQNLKIEFNIQERSWIIFTAKVDDDRIISYISTDMGKKWSVLQDNVMASCLFAVNYLNVKTNNVNKNLIFCPHYSSDSTGITRTASLKSSTDFFATQKDVLPNLQSFWADHKNVLIGTTFVGSEFQLFTSYDGSDWKRKLLTHSLNITNDQTLLFDIKTRPTLSQQQPQKEVEFFVMDKNAEKLDVKFGEIYKSDSNGDRFILMQTDVNYEDSKIDYRVLDPRLKGIVLANIVLNANTFIHNTNSRNKITKKIIQSQISFDDGSSWNYIAPPKHDSNNKKYQCAGKTAKECSLHLHCKTSIPKDTKTSQPAVGLVVANGNVGDALGDYNNSDTFLSVDAGISWKEIKKGPYKAVFGNHGTLIVLVDTKNPTNKIGYSYDYGKTWKSFEFTDNFVAVNEISTVQSKKYTTFLLYGTNELQKSKSTTLFRVSFDGDKLPSCYKYKNYDKSDFEIVSLRHPQIKNQECLFGRRWQITRRKPNSICAVKDGQMNEIEELASGEQCQCTKFDYECDTNYFKTSKGKCQVFADLENKIKAEYSKSCREMVDSVVEYELPSGYRKTSITSCIGGLELNKPLLKACEGKQNEFDNVHVGGLRGFRFFMLVVMVILGVAAIGYIGVKYLYITKANIGRIRLAGGDYDDIGYDVDDEFVFNDDIFYLRPNINSFGQLVKYEVLSLLRAVYGLGRTTVDMVVELLKEPGNRQRRAAIIRLDDRIRRIDGDTRAGEIGQRNRSTFRDYEDQDDVALLQGSVDEWTFSSGKKK